MSVTVSGNQCGSVFADCTPRQRGRGTPLLSMGNVVGRGQVCVALWRAQGWSAVARYVCFGGQWRGPPTPLLGAEQVLGGCAHPTPSGGGSRRDGGDPSAHSSLPLPPKSPTSSPSFRLEQETAHRVVSHVIRSSSSSASASPYRMPAATTTTPVLSPTVCVSAARTTPPTSGTASAVALEEVSVDDKDVSVPVVVHTTLRSLYFYAPLSVLFEQSPSRSGAGRPN